MKVDSIYDYNKTTFRDVNARAHGCSARRRQPVRGEDARQASHARARNVLRSLDPSSGDTRGHPLVATSVDDGNTDVVLGCVTGPERS